MNSISARQLKHVYWITYSVISLKEIEKKRLKFQKIGTDLANIYRL